MSKKSAGPNFNDMVRENYIARGYSYKNGVAPENARRYRKFGDTMSTDTQAGSADVMREGFWANPAHDPDFIEDKELETLTDVFNRRLESIKERRERPGLLLTRGEK